MRIFKPNFNKRIFVSITGPENKDWQTKLEEINRFKIKEAAVFIEWFDKKERPHLYKFLKRSTVKKVPFVHLRHDADKSEIEFFMRHYGTRHFNIHENSFDILDKWKGYWKNLYLETNYDDIIKKNVKVRRIGGFCVDLAHFNSALARGSEEAAYIYERKDKIKFACNHIGGYDEKKRRDVHQITDISQFDYLTSLPKFVFSKIMPIEVNNSIEEQLSFKQYIVNLLSRHFN